MKLCPIQVSPAEFIPITERSNLIHRIFEFTLRATPRDTQRLIELGVAPRSVAVNVSPANLRLDDIERRVRPVMSAEREALYGTSRGVASPRAGSQLNP